MIDVKSRFSEVFDQLPVVAGGQPYFDFGNETHLLSVLKRFSEAGENPYPILYMMSNVDEQDNNAPDAGHKMYLVVATRNTEVDLLNKNRWALSYRNVLFPVVELVEKCLDRAGIFVWDGKYKVTEYPNYGNGKENFTADIWDALVIETDVKILGSQYCVNNINFNF